MTKSAGATRQALPSVKAASPVRSGHSKDSLAATASRPRPPKRSGPAISLRSRERRVRQGVAGVERLHAGFAVTVERCHRAVLAETEVVGGRVGGPHAD